MRIYWSDREGNPAPSHCQFRWRPFFSNPFTQTTTQQTKLPSPASYRVIQQTFLPDKRSWIENVERALTAIEQKQIEKVVLARACILELEETPDPFAITAALKQKAQGAFVFCIESPSSAFLGATPERLFARQGNTIVSEALAGTCRRGQTAEEDQRLQKILLNSQKENREFRFVEEYLKQTLTPICTAPLHFSPLTIHQTQNVQHLYCYCKGELKEKVSDETILNLLHPTPALCGTPKLKAYSLIQQLEPFERGLYTGVIGWATPEASEWAVGVRSCLIEGTRVTLFSGAGIVAGSNPILEWEELNQKLSLYQEIFNPWLLKN